MNKRIGLMACALVASAAFAQEEAAQSASVAEPAPQEIAASPVVETMLLEDDGVSIVTAPDGSYRIFTKGTGVYRFSDPQVELNARKVAKLNAEKNLAEFISKKVVADDGVESLAKNTCTLDGDGKVQSSHPTTELLEDLKGKIVSNTSAVLSGLVVVESKKIPTQGQTSGTIQVKMVYSSKTGKAAEWVGKKMQEHQAALKEAPRKDTKSGGATSGRGSATGSDDNSTSYVPENKAEHRINNTEY